MLLMVRGSASAEIAIQKHKITSFDSFPPINICKAFICFCRSAEEEAAA